MKSFGFGRTSLRILGLGMSMSLVACGGASDGGGNTDDAGSSTSAGNIVVLDTGEMAG